MDFMIAVVVIVLIGFVLYTVYTTPDSSGCVSIDARRQKEAAATARAPAPRRRAEPPAEKEAAPTAAPVAAAPASAVAAAPAASRTSSAPAAGSAAAASAAPRASTPAAAPAASAEGLLRNPATGEKAAVPANYRFAKKWIKDALVKEGLLDKVYKNNELDAAASKKVKAALDQLKTLDKYKA